MKKLLYVLALCAAGMTLYASEQEELAQEMISDGVYNENPAPFSEKTLDDVQMTYEEQIESTEPKSSQKEEEEIQQREKDSAGFRLQQADTEDTKRGRLISFVDRAQRYFNERSLEEACSAFTRGKKFIEGDLSIFLIDQDGTIWADGSESYNLWQNIADRRDRFGNVFFRDILNAARRGGDWVSYEWRNVTKQSYVKLVKKGEREFVIGSGYYPHSKADKVINLVRGAIDWIQKIKSEGRPIEEAFGDMNYPLGRFVDGDTFLYVIDNKGTVLAYSDMPSLIGTNMLDYKSENGIFVNREVMERLKNSDKGIWIEYISRRARYRSYAEKYTADNGITYYISSGYAPDADRKAAVDLVRRGFELLKKSGIAIASEAFTTRANNEYRYGTLYLEVYNFNGECLAHGEQPDFVGRNFYDAKDQGGRAYVRAMIRKAKSGGGWISARLSNSLASIYIEPVDLGVEKLLIACVVFPVSKGETMMLLTKTGVSYLQAYKPATAFKAFTDRAGRFIRGDLELYTFDTRGFCYAYGDDQDVIWRNLLDMKDDNGRDFIKQIINNSLRGPARVRYRLNGRPKVAYAESVKKEGRTFIVGSSMFE